MPMADRPRHPKKDVEGALQYCDEHGWIYRKMGHWGWMYCPHPDHADRCHIAVNGTPKNEGAHAKQIVRAVDRCPHWNKDDLDEGL